MTLGLDMLDVAIGVVFVFLLVSLIASAIAEMIEVWLKRRSTDLEKGIRELLSEKEDLVAALYNHPLIQSLYKGDDYARAKAKRDLPSYIPARSFALAAFDLLFPQGSPPPADDAIAQSVVKSTDALQAYVDAHPTSSKKVTIEELGPKLATVVLNMIKEAKGDAEKIRQSLETWFNSSMDRVSGWYKRWNHEILIGIGILLAIVFNIDTVLITQSLSVDKSLRDAAVQTAVAYSKSNAQLPAASTDTQELDKRIRSYQQTFHSLGLPVGWTADWDNWQRAQQAKQDWTDYWPKVALGHLLGWIITAFAVSMGAPFWFDMLNKIVVIRSTVKPQEKSPDEQPKG